MEMATGVAHPPGGLHHNNKIPLDYTRVEVHTMKLEFMQWMIDYATPEGLVLLGDVVGQFIHLHKRDIILIASSSPPPLPNLERVVEAGEIFSPSCDPHIPEMPHSSPPPSEHVPDKPQPSPARTEQVHNEMPQSSQQAQPIHEQRVPPKEGDAQEDEDVPEWELQKKIPINIGQFMFRSKMSRRCPSGIPMTSSSLRTKLK